MLKFFKKQKSQFVIPCSGKLLNIEDVPDIAFSNKGLGDGFAIELTEKTIVSPFDGVVQSIFPTGHAFGIVSDKGYEILIHLGLDTVELKGDGFEALVNQGQRVKKGEVICNVDIQLLKQHDKCLISPIVFTGGNKFILNKEYGELVESNEEQVFTII